jgi:hypothetical protein
MKHLVCCLTVFVAMLLPTSLRAQYYSHTVTVSGYSGDGADYSTLKGALDHITDASSSNTYRILVYPGVYTGCNNGGALAWKSYVSLEGVDRGSTIIRGSCSSPSDLMAVLEFEGTVGVDVSNITLDGSAQAALNTANSAGSVELCGATITFNKVTVMNGSAGYSPGYTLSSFGGDLQISCSGSGSVTVHDSDVGPILDAGGDWTIVNSRVIGEAPDGVEYIYTYGRIVTADSGRVLIVGSTLEARARVGASVGVSAFYVYGQGSVGAEARIIGSTIVASNFGSSATGSVTAAIYEQPDFASGTLVSVEGCSIGYQSAAGVSGGEFYGIYSPDGTTTPVRVRKSSIHGAGSGGSRADVYADTGTSVSLAATEYSSVAGDGSVTTADLGQANFSTNLIVPLSSPTPASVNGNVWIDTGTNKLCYRSGGTTRCVLGS